MTLFKHRCINRKEDACYSVMKNMNCKKVRIWKERSGQFKGTITKAVQSFWGSINKRSQSRKSMSPPMKIIEQVAF